MNTSPPNQPWHALHYHRIRAGLSLTELAEKAGLSRQYVGFLENGERPQSDRATVQLAAALGVDPAELRADVTPNPIDPQVFDRLDAHLASINEQLTRLRALHTPAKGAA